MFGCEWGGAVCEGDGTAVWIENSIRQSVIGIGDLTIHQECDIMRRQKSLLFDLEGE